jgi:hypothetical protein
MPNPVDHHELYDVFVLAGQESPGVCKLGMPTRDYGWEKSEPAGSDGGEVSNKGKKLMEFEVELYLWKDPATNVDHFARWESWKQILLTPVAKSAPKALDCYHPQLDGLGITSVVAKAWNEPQPDGKGGGIVKIKFLEYAPAKPKPKGSGKPKSAVNLIGTVAGPMTQEQILDFQAQNGFDPRDPGGFVPKGTQTPGDTPAPQPTQDPPPDPNQDLLDELERENQRSKDLE